MNIMLNTIRIFPRRLFYIRTTSDFLHVATPTKDAFKNISDSKKRVDPEDEMLNKPIKYFGSEAAQWRAQDTRSGGSQSALWYQPYVISGSLAIFLIYFCILREESDIDRRLEGNLFEQVDGIEEVALVVNYRYNKEHGLDTSSQEQRLRELGVDIKKLYAH